MGAPGFYQSIVSLYELDVAPVWRRRDSKGKIVHVGEGEAERDLHVKVWKVNNEQQGGDRRLLEGAHRYRGEDLRRSLE